MLPAWQRDLAVLAELGLTLRYTVETHVHADHLTSAARLKRETGCRIVYPALDRFPGVDRHIDEGRPLLMGGVLLEGLATPGHTDDHYAYRAGDRVLTGDALLIDGCGRTDFQNGDAATLYRSVHDKLFALPSDTLVYPGHDYQQRHVSTVGQERERNPRLGGGKTLEDFVAIMAALDLPRPKKMDVAVPANRACGGSQIV